MGKYIFIVVILCQSLPKIIHVVLQCSNWIFTGCGGILKENAGVVKSPEHPDYYQSDLICMWIIVAPPGDVIQLTWLLFNLEESNSCSFDYVEIYNSHVNNELVGRFCGSKPPPVLVSSSNTLTIKFVTDSSINYDGFMASYIFTNELSGKAFIYY